MNRERLAGRLWAAEIVFFITNVVAQAAWTLPYDPLGYAISDLGAVSCFSLPDQGRDICSPAHLAMNLGLIITGLLMAIGALLFPLSRRSRLDRVSRALLVIGGLGCALVGFAPRTWRSARTRWVRSRPWWWATSAWSCSGSRCDHVAPRREPRPPPSASSG